MGNIVIFARHGFYVTEINGGSYSGDVDSAMALKFKNKFDAFDVLKNNRGKIDKSFDVVDLDNDIRFVIKDHDREYYRTKRNGVLSFVSSIEDAKKFKTLKLAKKMISGTKGLWSIYVVETPVIHEIIGNFEFCGAEDSRRYASDLSQSQYYTEMFQQVLSEIDKKVKIGKFEANIDKDYFNDSVEYKLKELGYVIEYNYDNNTIKVKW